MIIREFLNWVEDASDGPRAAAAGALARVWIQSELDAEDRRMAGAALTFLLDDPCMDVRAALAEGLAASDRAPRHVVLSLAEDVEPIAETVLKSSPLFTEAELVDAAASGSDRIQCAIAARADLSAGVCAALSEVGCEEACLALLANSSAHVLHSSLIRIDERHGDDMAITETLLKRTDLPLVLRHTLLSRLADNLESHPLFAEKVPAHLRGEFLADAADKVSLHLALEASDEDMAEFVEHLRDQGVLTTKLLLRAVCCGRLRLFAAALSLLGGIPSDRLRHVLMSVRMSALKAILRKAGLPLRSHQAFLLAIEIARSADADFTKDLSLDQARNLTESLLSEIQDGALGADEDVVAFLRRFAVDVARLEARALVKGSPLKALRAA